MITFADLFDFVIMTVKSFERSRKHLHLFMKPTENLVNLKYSLENIGEIHYHKENKTNGGKQIEFSTESNQSEKKNQKWE